MQKSPDVISIYGCKAAAYLHEHLEIINSSSQITREEKRKIFSRNLNVITNVLWELLQSARMRDVEIQRLLEEKAHLNGSGLECKAQELNSLLGSMITSFEQRRDIVALYTLWLMVANGID